MKQFWLSVFGSIVGVLTGVALCLVLAALVIGGLIGSALEGEGERALPGADRDLVLMLDLREVRLDQPSGSPLAFDAPLSMVELSRALQQARADSRVAAVWVRAATSSLPPAQAEEINALLGALSAAGKPVIAHAQGFEDGSILPYLAVSAADELWMQDNGLFTATASHIRTLLPGGLIEPVGIQSLTGYPDAHHEAMASWLGSIQDSARAVIAQNREMGADLLRARLEAAPYSAEQALDLGLVDRLGHVAEARAHVLDRIGTQARLIDIADYHHQMAPAPSPLTPVIALVEAQGEIVAGASTFSPVLVTAGGDTLADALQSAAEDPAVAAVILRIDSLGGSAIAADQIRNAVQRVRQAGKPVIASLGDRATAGGYYIAAPADRIIANASTLTGAIGQFSAGQALFPAPAFTPEQQAAYLALEEEAYGDFTRTVALGRDLPQARIQALARGRIWTGHQAHELGLVDEIGGFDAALASARERAGLSPSQPVRLQRYPAPPTGLETLEALLGVSLEGMESVAALKALLESAQVQSLLQGQAQQDAPEPAPPALAPAANPL